MVKDLVGQPDETQPSRVPTVLHAWVVILGSLIFGTIVVAMEWSNGLWSVVLWGWYAPVAFVGGLWMLSSARRKRGSHGAPRMED